MQLVPLDFLATGESAVVRDVQGPADQVMRLAEMGLAAGVKVQMLVPGRPALVLVGTHRLSLRLDDEIEVLVEPAP